jgi:glycosyltransferase involved in cell wall biosynthesis
MRLGIDDRVRLHGRIPIEAVPAAVAAADIGLAPTRRDRFTDVSLSTKVFEYAAMGKPVVATRLPLVERTFPVGTVRTYEAGDAASLATAIVELADDPVRREVRVAATVAIVRERSWEHEAIGYVSLVESLIRR